MGYIIVFAYMGFYDFLMGFVLRFLLRAMLCFLRDAVADGRQSLQRFGSSLFESSPLKTWSTSTGYKASVPIS